MQKPALTDHDVSELLSSIWLQLVKAKGETVHAETALRVAERAVMMTSVGLTGAMDRARGD